MAVKRWINLREQFFDTAGNPLNGGKLFFYAAGSSTKQNTYNSSLGTNANADPMILDAYGRPQSEVWLTSGLNYKIILTTSTDTDPPVSPIWTEDVIAGINDTVVTIDQWISGPTPTYVSATSFTLVGDQTSTFTPGRALKITDSGGTKYGFIKTSVFGALTTIVLDQNSAALATPTTAVSYGIASPTSTSIPILPDTIPLRTAAADESKQVALGLSGLTTATTRTWTVQDKNITVPGLDDLDNSVCDGRLTLTTLTPVTTADVSAATTIYFTPYKGKRVALYDGANWLASTLTEQSLAVPNTTSQMYDVFAFANAGAVNIEALAWTNDTTRATALVLQDGVLSKSGALTRRYIGSFRTTTVAAQTEDSVTKRYVWNYYNRISKVLQKVEATATWNYSTAAYRQANAAAANQIDIVVGVAEEYLNLTVIGAAVSSTATLRLVSVAVGVDSTTVGSGTISVPVFISNIATTSTSVLYRSTPPIGRHFYAWLEFGAGTDVQTWAGASGSFVCGITGDWKS